MSEAKGITCKLLNGSEISLSEGDRVLSVRMVGVGIPITIDAVGIIDDVLATFAEAQQTIAKYKGALTKIADSKRDMSGVL